MTLTVTTDLERIDLDAVHRWLSQGAYWALGRPRELVQRAAEGSLNIGVVDGDELVGYGRLVTDRVTFAWLCDVFVPDEQRGRGIGLLVAQQAAELTHELGLTRTLLVTQDAHGLYERVGFETFPRPLDVMALVPPRG